MKSNFYEKIIPIKTKEQKDLIRKMDSLLNESIDILIDLRKRQANNHDVNNIFNFKRIFEVHKFTPFSIRENYNINNIVYSNRSRNALEEGVSRDRRIINMEEERDIRPNAFLELIE